MKKTKPLKPSLREKKRYVVFEVISKQKVKAEEISKEISKMLKELIGLKGSSEAGVMFINNQWNHERQTGIFRVNNRYADELKASFAMLKSIDDDEVLVRSIGISSTIKKAKQKFLER